MEMGDDQVFYWFIQLFDDLQLGCLYVVIGKIGIDNGLIVVVM